MPLAPTLTGPGEITSWAINSTLPSGLNFGTNNGTIWGIPTQLLTTTNYTIWANNSGGSSSAEINITIVDQIPVLSYSPSTLELTNNTVSSDLPLAPTLTGPGEITSWAINSTLPSGLNFGTNNGTIWGIPTQLFSTSNFTIWANNSGGSSSTEINITIVDELPSLSYSPKDLGLTNNTVSSDLPLVPTLSGSGEITSWAINASLPSGLNFGTNNGTIWGIPTQLFSTSNFTIWANNSGGSISAEINITIVDQIPVLSYSPSTLELTNNTVSSDLPLAPTLTGPGEITSWAINATLPAGLNFGTSNGTIWGIPTQLFSTSNFTIWANNSGGSSSAEINITIVDQIPVLSYSPSTLELTNNTVSSDLPLAPTLTGPGEITSWAINATLPSGLNFGTNNGTIWGIPTQLFNASNFTIWANNSGGSTSAEINITIVDQVPVLSYVPSSLNLSNNTVSSDLPLAPTLTGPGEITSWAINATLPSGLNFGTSNGTIWGIPTQLFNTSNFTIWANNSGGSTSAEISITIIDELPSLSYSPTSLNLTNNTVSSDLPLAPTLTGAGEITSWEINASLPSGLNFGTSNGTIWGIPTQLFNTSNFTIWANNSGGSSSAEINITIVDQVPVLSYVPSSLNLTNNTVSIDLPLNAILTGPGEITSWAINATLPSGLNFGLNNGTIWGIPTQVFNTSNFTIWANNSGGSSSAEINIIIVDQVPVLSYVPSSLNLTNNTVSIDLPLNATLTGPGEITSWAINATLPSGLNFGLNNGTIWGVPTQLFNTSNFTIWANNSEVQAVQKSTSQS